MNTKPFFHGRGEEEPQELRWDVDKQARLQEQRRVSGQSYATIATPASSYDTTDLGLLMDDDEMASWRNYFPVVAVDQRSSLARSNAVSEAATTADVKRTNTCNESGDGLWRHVETRKQKEKIEEECNDGDNDDDDHIINKGNGRKAQVRKEERKKATKKKVNRRTRAAEVHNLSERRRRDKINEKMRILQTHIPRCNKSDKASILDDAVEYISSLQLQIQMMYSGYTMFPMMYPGIQRYSPALGLGNSIGVDTTPGCLVPQHMLRFPSAIHESPMLSSISSNLSSMMLIPSACPPSITPRAETSFQDSEYSSFLRDSYPKQLLNFQNHYPNSSGPFHAEIQSENRASDSGKGKQKDPRMPN